MTIKVPAFIGFSLGCLTLAAYAHGAIVLAQPWDGTADGWLSKYNFVAAEDVAISSQISVESISWSGIYANGMPGVPTPPTAGTTRSFTVRFFADVNQAPVSGHDFDHTAAQSPFYSQTVAALVTAVEPTPNRASFFIADYQVALNTPIDLQPGAYWISIVSPSAAPEFYWAKTNLGSTHLSRANDTGAWSEDRSLDRSDVVFALEGTPVPEPNMVALTSLQVCWFLRRARRDSSRNVRIME